MCTQVDNTRARAKPTECRIPSRDDSVPVCTTFVIFMALHMLDVCTWCNFMHIDIVDYYAMQYVDFNVIAMVWSVAYLKCPFANHSKLKIKNMEMHKQISHIVKTRNQCKRCNHDTMRKSKHWIECQDEINKPNKHRKFRKAHGQSLRVVYMHAYIHKHKHKYEIRCTMHLFVVVAQTLNFYMVLVLFQTQSRDF